MTATNPLGAVGIVGAPDADPPSGLVQVSYGGDDLTLWPYASPNGEVAEDPINLVFVGKARALEIRAALLALDGDRTAGFRTH